MYNSEFHFSEVHRSGGLLKSPSWFLGNNELILGWFEYNNNIITLFQEDNIFGTNASLTYGPQIQRYAFDDYKTMKIIYSMYRAGEVSAHRACCELAIQPYSLGGGGTIYPGSRPGGVTTRSPRMVTECLLTRSIFIKMYLPLHGMCSICTLYLQSVNFMQLLT